MEEMEKRSDRHIRDLVAHTAFKGLDATAEAQKIVAIWNARQAGGRALWFYPTIGAAIAAGFPWLTYSCPACRMFGSVDLRRLDRRPGASISSLIPSLSCRRCLPHAPFAKLEMLTAERP
jgi:hypothetical protein